MTLVHSRCVFAIAWVLMIGAASDTAFAHPWHRHRRDDHDAVQQKAPPAVASRFLLTANAKPKRAEATDIAKAFEPFVDLKAISVRMDDRYFFVESNGIPDHPLMIGIRAWQQQVPLPQRYVGDNAWQIPLEPVPAADPIMPKNKFVRGRSRCRSTACRSPIRSTTTAKTPS
jgi:hypothetical protein